MDHVRTMFSEEAPLGPSAEAVVDRWTGDMGARQPLKLAIVVGLVLDDAPGPTVYHMGVGRGCSRAAAVLHAETMTGSEDDHGGISVEHERQLPRLRRIEGQVRGLQQMVADRRYCIDIGHQIEAVVAALRRVQSDMIRDHLEALIQAMVANELPEDQRRRLADEIATLISRSS